MDKREFLPSSMALGAIYSPPGFDLEPIVSMKGLQVLTAALFRFAFIPDNFGAGRYPCVTGAPFTATWIRTNHYSKRPYTQLYLACPRE